MNRALWLLFVALGTIALAFLAWYMSSVVVTLVAAIFLGATMRPLGQRLTDFGVPRTVSVLLMALLIVIGALGLVAVVGYSVAEELPQLVRELQTKWLTVRSDWREGAPWQQTLAESLGDPLSLDEMVAVLDNVTSASSTNASGEPLGLLEGQVTSPEVATPEATPSASTSSDSGAAPPKRVENAGALLRLIIEATGGIASLLGQLIILVFVSIYWTLEHEWFERLWTSLLPPHVRQPARVTWRAVETNVGIHLRSEIAQSILAFVLTLLLFRLLGIHQSMLLATVVAFSWLIPLVGWLIALIVLAPVALLNPLWVMIAATVGLLAIFALLEFVVEARLDKARDKLEDIVGLIFAMVLLDLFGLLGLLLASPVAVALATAARVWSLQRTEQRAVVKDSAVETLRARVEVLRRDVDATGEELPLRTRSLYERFEALLSEAEPLLRRTSNENDVVNAIQIGKSSLDSPAISRNNEL